MSSPIRVGAADAVPAEECRRGRARIARFQGVGGRGLNQERNVLGGLEHALYDHTSDLTCDDIVRDSICHLVIQSLR